MSPSLGAVLEVCVCVCGVSITCNSDSSFWCCPGTNQNIACGTNLNSCLVPNSNIEFAAICSCPESQFGSTGENAAGIEQNWCCPNGQTSGNTLNSCM